jgi:hypothetical protein
MGDRHGGRPSGSFVPYSHASWPSAAVGERNPAGDRSSGQTATAIGRGTAAYRHAPWWSTGSRRGHSRLGTFSPPAGALDAAAALRPDVEDDDLIGSDTSLRDP